VTALLRKKIKQGAKHALWNLAPGLSYWKEKTPVQEFSIGICRSENLLGLDKAMHIERPVLTRRDVTDVPAAFVADPFLCRHEKGWYMFFEVLNQITSLGEIGVAWSADGMSWDYQKIVLKSRHHLSYPYVFRHEGTYYMVPECSRSQEVTIYRSSDFPFRWEPESTILHGKAFLDTSLFYHGNSWWLFTATKDENQKYALHLFFSNELHGGWQEHPASPVARGLHVARPAGRVVPDSGRLYRFAQDGYPVYGSKVHLLEISCLTRVQYEEKRVSDHPFLTQGEYAWNSGGMHHIDPHRLGDKGWLACVDGFRHERRPA